MTENQNEVITKDNETKDIKVSFTVSENFQKFLTVLIGTFFGVFFALSLFAYTHPAPKPFNPPCACMKMHAHHFGMPGHHGMHHPGVMKQHYAGNPGFDKFGGKPGFAPCDKKPEFRHHKGKPGFHHGGVKPAPANAPASQKKSK